MTPAPARVVVFRSSRYLPLALDATRRRWPGAAIVAVCQPGTGGEAPGAAACLEFTGGRFTPWRWLASGAAARLRDFRPSLAVIQLPAARPEGGWALGVTALLASRGRVVIVSPDGQVTPLPGAAWLGYPFVAALRLARNALLVAALAAAAIVAVVPWAVSRLRWRRARLAGRSAPGTL
ncbi:MAG: hypothetical protein AB7H88_00835 [Vicinamibacterales bacterium]